MEAIKKFNSFQNTGNPVYVTDLTYPTELIQILNSALNNFGREAYIMSGFDDNGAGAFTPGIVWHAGQVYAFEGDSVPNGQYLFSGMRSSDQRTTIDGQSYYAYSEFYLFTGTTNTSENGFLVDNSPISASMITRLKSLPLAPNSVTGDNIAGNTIQKSNLAAGASPMMVDINSNGGFTYLGNYVQWIDSVTVTVLDATPALVHVEINLSEEYSHLRIISAHEYGYEELLLRQPAAISIYRSGNKITLIMGYETDPADLGQNFAVLVTAFDAS